MKKSHTLFILFFVIALVYGQDMNNPNSTTIGYDATQGAMYRHIYSTLVKYAKDPLVTPPPSTVSITSTLPAGIFDDNQQITAASGLVQIDGQAAQNNDASPQARLILKVKSITVNNARTSFNMTLQFNTPSFLFNSTYEALGFNVILIGSKFNYDAKKWTGSPTPLAGAMARNSDLIPVTDVDGAIDFVKANFTGTNGQPSPFAFTPSSSSGCGVRKVGTAYQIQTNGCQKSIFLTFVTGFSHKVSTSAGGMVSQSEIDIQSILVRNTSTQNVDPVPGVAQPLTSMPTTPATIDPQLYIYNPTTPGLWIRFESSGTSGKAYNLQFGLVAILITGYIQGTYPTQSVNPDSFITAVGYFGQPYIGAAGALSDDITNTSLAKLYDGIRSQTTPGTALNTTSYYQKYPSSNMGHIFCGLQKIRGTNVSLDLSNTVTTTGGTTTNNLFLQTIDYQDNIQQGTATCVLFAAAEPCVSTQTNLTINAAKYNSSLNTTGYTLNTSRTDNAPAEGDKPNYYQFNITGISGKSTSTIINMTYTIGPLTTATEYVLDLIVKTYSAIPSAQSINYTVTINGTVYPTVQVIDGTDPYQIEEKYYVHVPTGTTQIPVSINVTTNNGAGVNVVSVYQSMSSFNKLLTSDLTCVNGCAEKAGYTTGINDTTSPPTCLYCPTTLNQVYQDNACVCKDYFYPATTNPLDCQPCRWPLCVDCDATACTVCVANAQVIGAGLLQGTCQCKYGFFMNGSICSPCPAGCAECSSPASCQKCVTTALSTNAAGNLTRENETLNCVCKPGYYEVPNSPICARCSSACLTCSGSASFCTSCPSTPNVAYNPSAGTCICADGFFLLNNLCVACSPVCETCSVGSIYCLTCPPNSQPAATGDLNFQTCECVLPFVEFQGVCVDSTCSSIPYCSTCAIQTTGAKFCITCAGNRILAGSDCVCKAGFYSYTPAGSTVEQCQPCGTGCQVCTNSSVCLTCATDATNNLNGTCTCQSGQFLTDITQSYICMACDRNCLTCELTPTNCKSCKAGFQLNALNKCVCAGATYPSLDGAQCISCPVRCLKCDNGTSCTTCQAGFTFDSATLQCTLTCSIGTYNAGTQCLSCPTGCTSCLNEYLCYGCLAGLNLYAGSCRAACPDSTWADRSNPTLAYGVCRICPTQCKTCTSATACSDCNDGFVLQAGACVASCVKGTYLSAGSCRVCNVSCAACLGTENTCTECPYPYVLYNSSCYQNCPGTFVNGICSATCPAGKYLSGGQCLSCDPKCTSCSVLSGNCTSCVTGYAYSGECVPACPPGMYAGSGFCGMCDVSCRLCAFAPQNCTQCQTGFIQSVGGSCVRTCGDGYYVDTAQQVCRACFSGCRTCTATACLTCTDPTQSPVGVTCQSVCPSGATFINGRCICNFGVLSNNLCVSSCPQGFYATFDRICERCTWPCLACQGSATTCLTCVSGYTYDSINRRCNRLSNCPYGLQDVNGVCVRICQFNQYFYRDGCISVCPDFTRPNENYACIEYVNPTFCQFPLFQQGSSCVSRCDVGYWPNDVTRACERCSSNCAQCFSATFCIGCVNGYFLNNDQTQCVVSQQCLPGQYQYNNQCFAVCPAGTYQSSYTPTCIRACPAGTYLDGNWCYSTCRTAFVTPDACVSVCPANVRCQPTGR